MLDSLVKQMAMKYNVGDKRVVFNTMQCYLTRQPHAVELWIQMCKKLNINLALKTVRGAYMVEERHVAQN